MRAAILLAAALLSACGSSRGLRPAEGERLPVAPYGATATPTPAELLTPSPQARPGRSDEVLRNSEQRRSDEFDLPPR
ncbi:hypothetical protein [Sphingomonas sp.]|jgi:hypothetical protein|uniref:hypothetical protein n=1 Tax=Sphingomonas sp. TaxID=28214 RepID=UPI002622B11C|nr:hypothetical protein [Sphingomonas sp.]MDF2494356.1 argininosuccinate lyase [Sphingomonas sp.]